jgi:prolipoprotein diacylglyceryltransferase
MISWWQHVPEYVRPIAFMLGAFSVRFYSLFFLAGFFAAWRWLSHVAIHDGRDEAFRLFLLDGLFWGFVGAIFGGRLGYAVWPDLIWCRIQPPR